MKKPEEIKPNYSPVYAAAMYPALARLFIDNGYALAIHGSLARDFDLVAVKWTTNAISPTAIIKKMTQKFAIEQIGKPEKKVHGRIAYTFGVGFGECALDLSFIN